MERSRSRSSSRARSLSEAASEPLTRWPPPGFPAMPAPSDEAATSSWMALCDASAGGAPSARIRTGESDESEGERPTAETEAESAGPDESEGEYPTAEEEAESVDLDERAHWKLERAWLLGRWADVAAEAARRQVSWEAEKAAEDALREEGSDEDASAWTPAEQAEARKEGAAMARAAAEVRARWKAAVAGIFAAVSAALETPAA